MSLQFLLPCFCDFRDVQLRQRLSFYFSPSWHQTAFNHVIGSGFPRLFLEHSPFDHFVLLEAASSRILTFSGVFFTAWC